ncbi:restriction endonuclease [Halosegnis longus]|uniref:Restriction endonuclease n=1 Tax=Halosegnis longus TaxID=2216012 RepID=A0AAJ4UVT4_9EURY|nr:MULTISPECIES: restriction endonuclease [Halobacteriales]RNJ26346.1 restriction endonuclease [Salella cibi]
MPILDELSGFEFEDVMEDVFRNLGYTNVRQAAKTADEGRDILMDEQVNGTTRGVVVECKHTGTVGRPVVQKLHSAIATYDFDGPKRGIVVTTGTFTGPATEYTQRLRDNDDPYPIELIDGKRLRSIAEEVGLDLYNGRIEILCDETLRPTDPTGGIGAPVREAFRDIENLDGATLPAPTTHATFEPVVLITATVDAVFETSVGVIHRINERTQFVVRAGRTRPQILDSAVATLVSENRRQTVALDELDLADEFDDHEVHRFGQTETEYKEWAVDRLRQHHTTTVSYTGDNNVDYERECVPNQSDISVRSIEPVYLPDVRQTTEIHAHSYPYGYYAAGPSRVTHEDGIHECVQCGDTDAATFTFCANCGSINCESHIKTERLEQDPVCTGCAVTDRFAFRTKYFYSEANRDAFAAEYDAMAVHEKAQENVPAAIGAVVGLVGVLALLLVQAGVV